MIEKNRKIEKNRDDVCVRKEETKCVSKDHSFHNSKKDFNIISSKQKKY